MYVEWADQQLKVAGINKRKLKTLLRKLDACGAEMKEMGLELYAASGMPCIVHESRPHHTDNAVADQGATVAVLSTFPCDGGDW